jgi:hypothetical protein
MSKTYIIGNPKKHTTRYILSEQQSKENAEAREACHQSLVDFTKAILQHNGKDWEVQFEINENRWTYLNIDKKHRFSLKFADDSIVIDNGGNSSRHARYGESKKFTKLFYDKELTLEKQGKKLFEVIESYINIKTTREVTTDKRERNRKMAAYIQWYLTQNNSTKEISYGVDYNESTISIRKSKDYQEKNSSEFTLTLRIEDETNYMSDLKVPDVSFTKYGALDLSADLQTKYKELGVYIDNVVNDYEVLKDSVSSAISIGLKFNFQIP